MSEEPEPGVRRRRTWACAFAAFVAGAAIASLAGVPATGGAEPRWTGDVHASVVSIEADGFRYAYHATTGAEALFDVKNDPRLLCNVLADHPVLAAGLRRSLESRLHVDSLGSLRALHRETIDRLPSLGYL